MSWYFEVWKKFATFSGRARRAEYWYFVLFNIIAAFIFGFIDGYTGNFNPEIGFGPLGGLYTLAAIIPGFAVGIRRLHDVGKSGWWLLIGIIPLIGWIWIFVLIVTEGDSEQNQYGPNPKLA